MKRERFISLINRIVFCIFYLFFFPCCLLHAQDLPRLMPLGDSITFGSGDYTDRKAIFGYRDHLQDELGIGTYDFVGPFHSPETNATYDVDHAGLGGATSGDVKNTLKSYLEKFFVHPRAGDMVLLYIGINDILINSQTQQIVDNVKGIIDIIDEYDPTIAIYVSFLVPVYDLSSFILSYNQYLVPKIFFSDWKRMPPYSSKKHLCVDLTKMVNKKIINYNMLLEKMLNQAGKFKKNVYKVDLYKAFKNDRAWPELFYDDGLHLNDTGYRIMARTWAKAIKKTKPRRPSLVGNSFLIQGRNRQ